MSYSNDESLPGKCDWCHDDRGQCDRPHLDEDRRFSIKHEETFDFETVRNDDKVRCYNCQEYGHYSKDRTQPRKQQALLAAATADDKPGLL